MNINACEKGSGGAVPVTNHYEAKIAFACEEQDATRSNLSEK
jgi:hypothetical protein